jgi:hypothetical protein
MNRVILAMKVNLEVSLPKNEKRAPPQDLIPSPRGAGRVPTPAEPIDEHETRGQERSEARALATHPDR